VDYGVDAEAVARAMVALDTLGNDVVHALHIVGMCNIACESEQASRGVEQAETFIVVEICVGHDWWLWKDRL
jgi:hypothetical protein